MNNTYEYYCPYKKKVIIEEMYFGETLHFFYGKFVGKLLLFFIFKRIWWGIFYRLYKKSPLSKKSIERDIKRFQLNMSEYKEESWKSYNHFFMRKFKEGMRVFSSDVNTLDVFAEGKYLVYDTGNAQKINIKGEELSLRMLYNDNNEVVKEDSYLIVARLCPTDYHHYHYPCSGKILSSYLVSGAYDSVNIFAQKYKPSILFRNKRWVSFLETNFGKIAYIEVGGMSVATIKNEHSANYTFKKGDLKGHFEYGGSSIILVVPKKNIKMREDLLENSKSNREVYLKLGDLLGTKII